MGVTQQAGASDTAAKSVELSFYFRLVITSAQMQVCISLSPTSTQSINLRKSLPWHDFSGFALYTTFQ